MNGMTIDAKVLAVLAVRAIGIGCVLIVIRVTDQQLRELQSNESGTRRDGQLASPTVRSPLSAFLAHGDRVGGRLETFAVGCRAGGAAVGRRSRVLDSMRFVLEAIRTGRG